MEEWQINHINSNLSSLIRNTRCTTNLMALLKEKELITDEDNENLLDLGKRVAASELYEILKTKLNGYDGVMEALKLDRQTGAWKTLNSGEETQLKSPENLEKQIQHLLNLPIQFYGHVSPLKDIFPEFKTENATDLLQQVDLNRDFHRIMAQQSPVLCLHVELPQPHPLYVSRSISNRLVLNPSIFRLECNDIFVFKGITRSELMKLVDPNVMRSSTEQLSMITCRHIHLDDDEDWDDLVSVGKSPIHLIEKEREKYVLLLSSKVSSTINAYVDTGEGSKSAYISEDTFVDLLSSDEKGALICDIPGMGKSWLMESLARKLCATQQNGKIIVFFIKLSELSLELGKLLDQPQNENALQFIFEYVVKSKFNAHILKELIQTTQGPRAIFFLDGFDEVADLHAQKTTTFLQELNYYKNVKIVISSRPNMRIYLEQIFNLISYDILPFDVNEQIDTIFAIWQQNLPTCKVDALKEFASKCIVSIKRLQKNDTREILGVPLRCYILAVINEKMAEQLSKPQRKKAMKITVEATINSLCDLYDKFVEVSMQKVASEKRAIIWSSHTLRALETLFPEIAEPYKESQKLEGDSLTSPELIHVGLLWQTRQFNSEFFHRSFAEYFVGKFFADFWLNMSSLDPSFVKQTGSQIVDKILKISVEGMDTLFIFTQTRFGNHYWPERIWSRFQSSPIMMFMNATDIRRDTTNEMHTFKKLLETKGLVAVRNVKESIKKHIYISMIECIDRKLFPVLGLILGMVKVFFKETEIYDLLIFPHALYINTKDWIRLSYQDVSEASIPLILYYGSYSGSVEAVNLLFNLFGNLDSANYLITFCLSYPLKYWCPLEIAITTNDIDMFMYFSNKMKLPRDRLLVRCLHLEEVKNGSQTNVDRRILMFKAVLDHLTMPHAIIMEDFKVYLTSLSKETLFHQWLLFLLKNKISLQMFPLKHMVVCGADRIRRSDEKIIWILLAQFKKPRNPTAQFVPTSLPISNTIVPQLQSFRAEDVLQQLNLKQARRKMKRFFNFYVKLAFHSQNVEILRIFLGIFPSLAPFADGMWDYLHFAVELNKLEWVKYLIKSGHDVNKQLEMNETPLFCLCGQRPVEMMRLLVENGADVNVVNTSKKTVVHKLIESRIFGMLEGLIECVNYMLDETEFGLWIEKDNNEKTPLDLLERFFGRSHPTIVAVHAKIESQGHKSTD